MPLFNLNDATPDATLQIGSALIRLDTVMSIDFSWNHMVNEKSSYAYLVEIIYENGATKNYPCSREQLYQTLTYLDKIDYFNSMYNLINFETFIDNLHQKYYDYKAFAKISQNIESQINKPKTKKK